MNNVIQPFIFEKPIEIPNNSYDIININKTNSTLPNYDRYRYVSTDLAVKDPKININYNNQTVAQKHIGKDNSNININIDTENKDKPIGLKLDLFFVDLEIYPKIPKILKCIGNLF